MFLCSRGAKTCGPFKCLVSSQLAEISSKYLKKGGKVYVEGGFVAQRFEMQSAPN
ncbi:single-stranded DNA-binding protein [Acinetobacter baumannii]|nr:single-stranded DNA-binding protein [Acinetobacter baumannii]